MPNISPKTESWTHTPPTRLSIVHPSFAVTFVVIQQSFPSASDPYLPGLLALSPALTWVSTHRNGMRKKLGGNKTNWGNKFLERYPATRRYRQRGARDIRWTPRPISLKMIIWRRRAARITHVSVSGPLRSTSAMTIMVSTPKGILVVPIGNAVTTLIQSPCIHVPQMPQNQATGHHDDPPPRPRGKADPRH